VVLLLLVLPSGLGAVAGLLALRRLLT